MIYNQLIDIISDYRLQIAAPEPFDPNFIEESYYFIKDIIKVLEGLNWEGLDELNQHKIKQLLFIWLDDVKQLFILIRDIHFKVYKDHFLISDGVMSLSQFRAEIEDSRSLLDQALEEVENKANSIAQLERINERLAYKWYHYLSPIEEYRSQFENITTQLKAINTAHEDLLVVAQDVKQNKQAIFIQLSHYENSMKDVLTQSENILTEIYKINSSEDSKDISKIANKLTNFYDELQEYKVKVVADEAVIHTVKDIVIPTHVQGGILIIKEFNINNHINQWLEEEVFPTILDINRFDELLYEKGLVGVMSTRNRFELLKIDQNEGHHIPPGMLTSPLEDFISSAQSLRQDIIHHTRKITLLVEKEYMISHVFSASSLFLKDKVEFSLVDYNRRRISLIKKWNIEKVKWRVNNLAHQYLPSFKLHRTSKGAVISFIKHNKLPELDQFSQSLFLKKGFIGHSFMMPRTKFEEILVNNFNNWKEGFRGSILVYGNRLSGRSAVLESVEHIIHDCRVIKLYPDVIIKYKGRKFQAQNKLAEYLEFIYKHALTDKVIVVIDDLELWRDKDEHLLITAKKLIEDYGKYMRRILFVVSTNHHVKIRLDSYIDFSNYFLSLYNTDIMDTDSIIKSLLIRHSASLREMSTNDESSQLNESNLRKMAKKIAIDSKNNIGVSLKNWSRFVIHASEHREGILVAPAGFHDLLREHAYIILHILRYRHTNEQELRQMIGNEYVRQVSEDIQLLLSYKILYRSRIGNIYVNEGLVQYVENFLRKEYLKPNTIKYV